MRSLLLAFLVCSPSLVNAQFRYDYPIVCDDTQKVISVLEKEFEEKLSWKGLHVNDKSVYSLWINEKTQNCFVYSTSSCGFQKNINEIVTSFTLTTPNGSVTYNV